MELIEKRLIKQGQKELREPTGSEQVAEVEWDTLLQRAL